MSLVVRSNLYLKLKNIFATKVAYKAHRRGRGRSAFKSMMEPGSLAGAPKWMKRPGAGLWVIEEDGRYFWISQPNLRYDSC